MQQFLSPATVQARRAELGLSTSELARRANVDRSSLANFELGHRGLGQEKLLRVASALGLAVQLPAAVAMQHRLAEPRSGYGKAYQIPRDAEIALSVMSDEDLGKYIRSAIDDPNSMPAAALGAFMHELSRRQQLPPDSGDRNKTP